MTAAAGAIEVKWLLLCLDTPEEGAAEAWAFWRDALHSTLSKPRGSRAHFATLLPAAGDPWVIVQAIEDGLTGVHLDLCVEDVDAASAAACELGAREIDAWGPVRVMRSPGGFAFCLVDWDALDSPSHQVRTGAAHSEILADQLALDVPAPLYEREVFFWQMLTGWPLDAPIESGDCSLVRPAQMPVSIYFQQVEDDRLRVSGHLDLASVDRLWHTEEHLGFGAEFLARFDRWTVMRAPGGQTYCITDHRPEHGHLSQ